MNNILQWINSLKSLRSVQISILEPKNYPQSSKNDQTCEKN